MFRSSTIIRELVLNLDKVTFMLKHSVNLRRYLLCGCVVACHGMACVACCAECTAYSYMFRSSTIIRELALNLAKVIFMLKHSAKLRRYLLCGCVAAYHGMACVLYAVHSAITLARFSASSLMMVEDRNI
jgi:hypothetical protein